MASSILSDNGVSSGSAGLKTSADSTGALALQTTTAGGAATTALTIDTSQNATFAGSVKTNTLTSAASTALTLQSAGTTAITVDTSQNVGVGLTSPSQKLDVSGSAQLTYAGGNNYLYFQSTNNYVGRSGSTGDIWLNTAGGQNTIFGISAAEKMRLTANGFLCINKTSTQYSETLSIATANQQGIHINETSNSSNINIQYFTKGTGFTMTGAIYYNGSVMAYLSTSDYRLKENVAPITNALNKISLLKPVIYTWKDNQRSGEGFLAHELQEHFPDAVSGTKDEVDENGKPKYQGVDTSVLIAAMVKAIQELKAINDTQAETLTQQTEAINALTARIVAIESRGTV
jgi:hypothetical protein